MKKRVLITVIAPAVIFALIVISARVVQERRKAAEIRPPSRLEQLASARKFLSEEIRKWSQGQPSSELWRKNTNYHLHRDQLAVSKLEQCLENQSAPCWMPIIATAYWIDPNHPWYLEVWWLDADGLGDSIELENTDGSIGRISLRPTTPGDARYFSVSAFRTAGWHIDDRAGPLTTLKQQHVMEWGEIAMPVAKLKKGAKIVLVSRDGSKSEAAPVLVLENPPPATESTTQPATDDTRESGKTGALNRGQKARQ